VSKRAQVQLIKILSISYHNKNKHLYFHRRTIKNIEAGFKMTSTNDNKIVHICICVYLILGCTSKITVFSTISSSPFIYVNSNLQSFRVLSAPSEVHKQIKVILPIRELKNVAKEHWLFAI
jgi:hypothetical protein